MIRHLLSSLSSLCRDSWTRSNVNPSSDLKPIRYGVTQEVEKTQGTDGGRAFSSSLFSLVHPTPSPLCTCSGMRLGAPGAFASLPVGDGATTSCGCHERGLSLRVTVGDLSLGLLCKAKRTPTCIGSFEEGQRSRASRCLGLFFFSAQPSSGCRRSTGSNPAIFPSLPSFLRLFL